MNTLLQFAYLKVVEQIHNQEGQDLVEYALMIVLVALGCVSGVNSVASAINTVFSNISATLS
jgi:Flp pilus assembly pilin Flp